MISILKSNWHIMRILRVVLGIYAVVEYFATGQIILLVIGGFFLVQGIFNTGCGGAGACEWSPDRKKR